MAPRTSFARWPCPMARAFDLLGDGWTLLILRESFFFGAARFADFQDSLVIPTNVLTNRLARLVDEGVLSKERAPVGHSLHRYRPTDKGAELWPVLESMLAWGNRWVTDAALPPLPLRHRGCGADVDGDRCARCGAQLTLTEIEVDREVFLQVAVDQLVRYGKGSFRQDDDLEKAQRVLRKLDRAGFLERGALVALLGAGGMSKATLQKMETLIS